MSAGLDESHPYRRSLGKRLLLYQQYVIGTSALMDVPGCLTATGVAEETGDPPG